MANPFFKFKQFTIHQEHCSMKVCTDACLFGAWVANAAATKNAKNILDIGTGTGLLSLMLAQASNQEEATITAVEIDAAAASEAASNIAATPWKDRIKLIHTSIQQYTAAMSAEQMDLIITNPPFYEGDLNSPDTKKNIAAHSTELPWSALLQSVGHLLQQEGHFFALVPTLRAYTLQKLAAHEGLHLIKETLVYNDAKHLPIRAMLHFKKQNELLLNATKKQENIERNKIVIKSIDNQYTPDFTALLKTYYLHF